MTRCVLYVLGAYPVWSETFLRQDLALLLKSGLPLYPVALFPGDTEREPQWPDVTALTSRETGGTRPRQTFVGWLPRRLRAGLSLHLHRRLRANLAALVRERDAVHIHAEFADLPGLLAAAAARDTGVSYSIGVHAHDVHRPKYPLAGLLGRARFVTVCNRSALRAVLEACPRHSTRVHLIAHGVDLRAWHFRDRPFTPHAELRLFCAGRLVEKKGADTLLRAAALLQRAGTAVRVQVAGSGPQEGQLRALARAEGIDGIVSWLGVLSQEQMRQTLDTVDCLVTPCRVSSDGDRDGIPNIVLEAMAAGVPVVGTGAGGLGEVLSSRTGWTFPPDDSEALAALLGTLAREPQEVEQRRVSARSMVEERFDACRLAEHRADLFQEVIRQALWSQSANALPVSRRRRVAP